jgi:hypothetical protein
MCVQYVIASELCEKTRVGDLDREMMDCTRESHNVATSYINVYYVSRREPASASLFGVSALG